LSMHVLDEGTAHRALQPSAAGPLFSQPSAAMRHALLKGSRPSARLQSSVEIGSFPFSRQAPTTLATVGRLDPAPCTVHHSRAPSNSDKRDRREACTQSPRCFLSTVRGLADRMARAGKFGVQPSIAWGEAPK